MVDSIDGDVEVGVIDGGAYCCPPTLCNVGVCELMCNFIHQLPTGPMWDEAKQNAFAFVQTCTDIGDLQPTGCIEGDQLCTHIIKHAMYSARKLHMWLHQGLGPSLQESNPYTATRTLDDWLERLGWEDCYDTACRSPYLGNLTPYEIMGECGPIYCPPTCPDELVNAIKHGTVVALHRLSKGIVKNESSINFVISSLGARVDISQVACVPGYKPRTCECCELHIAVTPTSDTIITAPSVNCDTPRRQIQAWCSTEECSNIPGVYKPKIAGMPDEIYPGVLAAECIVRSLLRSTSCRTINYYCG